MFGGVAVMGFAMFGESTESQFTLNMPTNLVSSKIAVWTTVTTCYTYSSFIYAYTFNIVGRNEMK